MPDFNRADETIEVLLEIKEQGMQNFAGAMLMFEALEKLIDRVAAATEKMSDRMDKASDQVKKASYAAYTGSFAAQALRMSFESASRSSEELADNLAKVRRQSEQTAAANVVLATTAGGLWGALTAPRGWAQVLVTALAIMGGPLLAFGGLVAMSTAVMGAWLVGGAAMIGLLGGLAVGFGVLGAAIIAMGFARMRDTAVPTPAQLTSGGNAVGGASQRLFDAQQAVIDLQQRIAAQKGPETLSQKQQMEDLTLRVSRAQAALNVSQSNYNGLLAANATPLATFTANLTAMSHRLEEASVPITQMAMNFASTFFPIIGSTGEQVISWFGVRMPGALNSIKSTLFDLAPSFSHLAGFLGSMFDKWSPDFSRRFEDAMHVVLPLTEGFVGKLSDLTTWFEQRLPTFGPVVNATFGWMGHAVESVAGVWGKFADWGASKFFPLIEGIKRVWAEPGATPGGTVGSEFLGTMARDLPVLGKELEKFILNSPSWLPAITFLASRIADLVTGLSLFLDGAGQMVGDVVAGFRIQIDQLTVKADNPDTWAGINDAAISAAKWISGAFDNAPDWLKNFDPFGFNAADAKIREQSKANQLKNLTGIDAKQNRDFLDPNTGVPKVGPAAYEAAQNALKTLQKVGIGGVGLAPVPTIGTDLVPAVARAQLEAAKAAREAKQSADAQLARSDRMISRLDLILQKIQAPTSLYFNVQGMSAADQATARLLRRYGVT